MENMENKTQTTELSPREEYHQEFLPQVHKIGATTMAIALILSLLPERERTECRQIFSSQKQTES